MTHCDRNLEVRGAHPSAPYVLIKRIDRGDGVHTWLAHDVDAPDRLLVVRRFPWGSERFEREIRYRFDHPGIVPVLDMGTTDRFHYVVREYVYGVSLGDVLRSLRGVLSPVIGIGILNLVCQTVNWLHAGGDDGRGVVHGALTPDTILLTASGDVRLINFDYARPRTGRGANTTATFYGDVHIRLPEPPPDNVQRDIAALQRLLQEMVVDAFYELEAGEPPSALHMKLNTAAHTTLNSVETLRFAMTYECSREHYRLEPERLPHAIAKLVRSTMVVR